MNALGNDRRHVKIACNQRLSSLYKSPDVGMRDLVSCKQLRICINLHKHHDDGNNVLHGMQINYDKGGSLSAPRHAAAIASGSSIAPDPTSPHASRLLMGGMTCTPSSCNAARCRAVNGLSHMSVFIAGATYATLHVWMHSHHVATSHTPTGAFQSPMPARHM